MKVLFRVLLTLSVCLCAGCGGSASNDGARPGNTAGNNLPILAELNALRESLSSSGLQAAGTAALQRSSAATDEGSMLLLDASGDNATEWALYGFDPAGRTVESLAVQLSLSSAQEAWVALADYEKQSWTWHGPVGDSPILTLDPVRHISPTGLVYCVIAAYSGNTVAIDSLAVRLKPLAVGEFIPGSQLDIDLPDSAVEVRCEPDMLDQPATVRVFEGLHHTVPEAYAVPPVQVELTLEDGTAAPQGTQYQYAYQTAAGHGPDYDITLYYASEEDPVVLYGWAKPDEQDELRKIVEYLPEQTLAVVDLAAMRSASSAPNIGLLFDSPADANKDFHVIFIHGLDPSNDDNPAPGYLTRHWDNHVPPGNPSQILSQVHPAVRPDVAVSRFYYNTINMPVFGPGGSGLFLAQQIQQKLLTLNPGAKVILVGYSMGGVLIRAGYDELCKAGKGSCILGAITLNGVNNGTEAINVVATNPLRHFFNIPDSPGGRDLRSVYDVQFFTGLEIKWTTGPNANLATIIDNPQYIADLWGTNKYIRIGSDVPVGGVEGPHQRTLFNSIWRLRNSANEELEAANSFLRAGRPAPLHDGWVSTGSQFAVGFADTTFDDTPAPSMHPHSADHYAALNNDNDEVRTLLQNTIASLMLPDEEPGQTVKLSGHVYYYDQVTPRPNEWMRVYADDPDHPWIGIPFLDAWTDSNGYFEFDDVPYIFWPVRVQLTFPQWGSIPSSYWFVVNGPRSDLDFILPVLP